MKTPSLILALIVASTALSTNAFADRPGRGGRGPGVGHGPRPGSGPGHVGRPGGPDRHGPRPDFRGPRPGHRPPVVVIPPRHVPRPPVVVVRPGHRRGPNWNPGWRGPRAPGWRGPRHGWAYRGRGWVGNRWVRPIHWRLPRIVIRPTYWVPVAPPPRHDFLCQGNFVGVFSGERDAFLALQNRPGDDVDGTLYVEGPSARYDVDGYCEQNGSTADVEISLNGGLPYTGTIYMAEDGQIYFEGRQEATGIEFVLRRE